MASDFRDGLRKRKFSDRIAEDVESADRSGVSGTPTFFINGRRHYGAYDVATLTAEVRAARARAAVLSPCIWGARPRLPVRTGSSAGPLTRHAVELGTAPVTSPRS